jgi:hypothetical protein
MGSERYTNLDHVVVTPDGLITAAGTNWDKQAHHVGWLMRLDDSCR